MQKITAKYRSIVTARDINIVDENESAARNPSDGHMEARLLSISFTGRIWYTVAIATE